MVAQTAICWIVSSSCGPQGIDLRLDAWLKVQNNSIAGPGGLLVLSFLERPFLLWKRLGGGSPIAKTSTCLSFFAASSGPAVFSANLRFRCARQKSINSVDMLLEGPSASHAARKVSGEFILRVRCVSGFWNGFVNFYWGIFFRSVQ